MARALTQARIGAAMVGLAAVSAGWHLTRGDAVGVGLAAAYGVLGGLLAWLGR